MPIPLWNHKILTFKNPCISLTEGDMTFENVTLYTHFKELDSKSNLSMIFAIIQKDICWAVITEQLTFDGNHNSKVNIWAKSISKVERGLSVVWRFTQTWSERSKGCDWRDGVRGNEVKEERWENWRMGVKKQGFKTCTGLSKSSTWLWLPHRNKPAPRPTTNLRKKSTVTHEGSQYNQ